MEVGKLLSDLIIVTLLGLFIAFSPMLIIVNLLIVLRSNKPMVHAVALIAGILTPLLLVAGLGLLFISPDSQISLRAISQKINIPPLIDLLFGLSLLIMATKQLVKPTLTPKPANAEQFHIPNDNFWSLYAFGFMKSLLSATNLFAVLVVVKIIIQSALNPLFDLALLGWTLAVGMIPFVLTLYYHRFRRGYLVTLNKRLNEVLARNVRRLIVVGLYALGSLFSLFGVWGLLHS